MFIAGLEEGSLSECKRKWKKFQEVMLFKIYKMNRHWPGTEKGGKCTEESMTKCTKAWNIILRSIFLLMQYQVCNEVLSTGRRYLSLAHFQITESLTCDSRESGLKKFIDHKILWEILFRRRNFDIGNTRCRGNDEESEVCFDSLVKAQN